MAEVSSKNSRPQELIDSAVAAAQSGDFAAAATSFLQALQLCPNDAALHEQYAQCLMELEQHEAALTCAQTATALQPQWAEGWVTLGRCYLNIGQLQPAHNAFSTSLVLNPDQPDTHQELAEVSELIVQQVANQVGLPDLAIKDDPDGTLGPGCIIWEAGIQLAKLLVTSSKQLQHVSKCSVQAAEATPATAAEEPPDGLQQLQPWQLLPGSTVLEVGSGTGIAGITAAALGACVTLTDLPELQPLLTANIAANQQLITAAGGSAAAAVMDWQHCTGVLEQQCWGWAMGADLVYNASQVRPVAALVAALLQGNGSRSRTAGVLTTAAAAAEDVPNVQQVLPAGFLLAHKHRHQYVDQQLKRALQQQGLQLQTVAELHRQCCLCYQGVAANCESDMLDSQQSQDATAISIWWIMLAAAQQTSAHQAANTAVLLSKTAKAGATVQ